MDVYSDCNKQKWVKECKLNVFIDLNAYKWAHSSDIL